MRKLILLVAVLASPVLAQDVPAVPQLNMQQQASLKCGTAFATVARGQTDGDAAMLEYPDMTVRGLEFFVRTAATLMDETGADREAMRALAMTEVTALASDPAALSEIMPACLLMLDASGL